MLTSFDLIRKAGTDPKLSLRKGSRDETLLRNAVVFFLRQGGYLPPRGAAL